jgi:ElaB/YqjD/DUF883 family membrane-anchored ribosome-binding protein
MATMTTTARKEAIKDCLAPTLEALEENAREARRAIVHGRQAAEDFVAETALQVRRHPLSAVAFAAGAGALAGCLIGFALGRRDERRTS